VGDDTKPARADMKAGDKVAGYQLEEQIGQGGMAVVYRALDEHLDRQVALKVLSPALAADTAFRTRFIRESRAAAAVDHPNIIPVYDAGDAGGCLFISMRYVQGGDVRALIADGHALPPARAWNIISQVASALDAAHARDLVHRDVKPANMLLDRRQATEPDPETTGQTKEHVYLSDFGISKQTVASNLTSTGQFVGTLDYIAPEQIEGKGLDGRADQYSLGCAAYELLSGVPPFNTTNGFALINSHLSEQARPITTLRPELPKDVDRVLGKAMSKTAAERYATCDQFAADLGRALGLLPGSPEVGGGPTATPASHPMTELAQPGQLAAAAAAGAAVGTGAAAGMTPAQLPTNPQALADPETQLAGHPSGPGQQPQAPMTGGQPGAGYAQPGIQPGTGQQDPSGQQWQGGYPGQPPGYGQYPPPYQTYPSPGGPGGPTGPGWPGYPQQQPKRSRGLLIGSVAGAIAVVVAGGVAFAVLHNGPNNNNGGGGGPTNNSSSTSPPVSSSPPVTTPVATARSQARAMNNLLMTSEQSRQQWDANTLVTDTGNCVNINYDVSQIQDIANERASELSSASALQTNLISNGVLLKSQLIRALRISRRIDDDYLAWAQQQQSSGCSVGTGSSYYQQATALDNRATDDKQIFVDSWDPVASQYGLNQYQAGDI
jgi:Protein kinase domain